MPTVPSKKQLIIGAAALTFVMLLRMRRGKKNAKKNASIAERYAFPVTVKSELAQTESLGVTLSAPVNIPPRLIAASVQGLPKDDSNPIESACVVVDVVTTVASVATTQTDSVEAKLFASLDSANEAALLSAVKEYITTSCPYTQGLEESEKVAAVCTRVADAPAGVSTAISAPTLAANATKKQRAEAEATSQTAPIELSFGFLVATTDVAVYVAPIAEARTIISLIIVTKDNATKGALADKDALATMLQRAFELNRSAVTRLVEDANAKEAATKVATFVPKEEGEEEASPKKEAVLTVLTNTKMKIRAVLPSTETTVETVRCPSVPGAEEVLISIKGDATGIVDNFARISYLPTMPSSWEDEKAITEPSEKEDEYRRNLMAHFLGYISNAITLHPIDISGRKCLWFGEQNGDICCRTYVCPNFDTSGKQANKKKNSSSEKGMTIIRWEGPSDQWDKSITVLNAFLDYFQFQ